MVKFSRLLLPLVLCAGLSVGCKKDDKSSGGGDSGSQKVDAANYPNKAGEVYGRWNIGTKVDQGINIDMELLVNANKVGLNVTCNFAGGAVVTGTESPARLTTDTIHILEQSQRTSRVTRDNQKLECSAHLPKEDYRYEMVNADQIRVTGPGINGEVYTRIQ